MKVLVIEDHPAQLKLAHHVLSAAGYNVSAAEAAEDAFASITEDRPQVILLDMALPGMDGLALVRKLKADPATRNILVVAVTSYPEEFPKATALAAGCDAYLLKPLSTRTLPDEISAIAIENATNSSVLFGNPALDALSVSTIRSSQTDPSTLEANGPMF